VLSVIFVPSLVPVYAVGVIYRFGVFTFDDRPMILARGGREVALEPQPARALALLLARAGDVVSRDELRDHLWGGDTHVDFDRGLAYCVAQLRSALGDAAENPRFVQTLPRRGFRFIAPVQADGDGPVQTPSVPAPASVAGVAPPAEPPVVTAPIVPGWISAAAIAVVALLVGAAGALMMARDKRPAPPPARPIVAVAVFDNETGDPSYARAVAAISDTLVERLTAAGPSRLGVNGHAPILRRPRDARDWRAVARETGASFLVSGELQTRDGHPSLVMQLVRLDDGTHVWVQRIARPAGDRLEALDADAAAEVDAAVRRLVLR
jgi:DNA-binding winged helix-turn-helix (wHTH) protein/TolB-like protein